MTAQQQTVRGMDIYHGDDPIDFHGASSQGVQFVIVKATTGLHGIDPLFDNFRQRIYTVQNLLFSPYGWIIPGEDGKGQAQNLLKTWNAKTGDLPCMLDCEQDGAGYPDTCREAAETVKSEMGQYPWIYTGDSMYQTRLKDAFPSPTFFLVIARYGPHEPQSPFNIWQFTDASREPGTPHPLDGDRFYGSLADLKEYTVQ